MGWTGLINYELVSDVGNLPGLTMAAAFVSVASLRAFAVFPA